LQQLLQAQSVKKSITFSKINNRPILAGIRSDSGHITMSLTAKVKRQEHHENSIASGRSSD
jgi:hypothetical protein